MTMPDDAVEPEDREPTVAPPERDFEASEGDLLEQETPVESAAGPVPPIHRGLEVNDYDAVEQAHVVEFDDEYR